MQILCLIKINPTAVLRYGQRISMAAPSDNQSTNQENKITDKELNFRNLEAKYQRELERERAEKAELQRQAQQALELAKRNQSQDEDDDDNEPYVDRKKLNKTLSKYDQSTKSEIQKAMESAKQAAKEELRQEVWLENNPDFYDVLNHAEKLAQKSPALAKSILAMPEGFERQKLVYQSIKEMGLHRPEVKQPSIQEKVDANRKGPYYQPSNVGAAPYSSSSDFSTTGQKQAYEKMQELKNRLRLG